MFRVFTKPVIMCKLLVKIFMTSNGCQEEIRHRAPSAGRDQFPAGPPLPLGNDQGSYKPFFASLFDASKTTPRATFATKNEKIAPENTQNDKKDAPRRNPRKVCQNTQNTEPTNPWNL